MKILKPGKAKEKTIVKTCKNCKAELEIGYRDIITETADPPYYPDNYYVKCPCCNERIYLAYDEVTSTII